MSSSSSGRSGRQRHAHLAIRGEHPVHRFERPGSECVALWGACTDFGTPGGSACDFAGPGAGHNYPTNGCTPEAAPPTRSSSEALNGVCLTDAQVKGELATMIAQTGVLGRTEPGYMADARPADPARRGDLPGRRGQTLLGRTSTLARPVLQLPLAGKRGRRLGALRRAAVDRVVGDRRAGCDEPGIALAPGSPTDHTFGPIWASGSSARSARRRSLRSSTPNSTAGSPERLRDQRQRRCVPLDPVATALRSGAARTRICCSVSSTMPV